MGDRARQRDSSEEGDRRDTRDKFRAERSTYESGRRSQPESHPDKCVFHKISNKIFH